MAYIPLLQDTGIVDDFGVPTYTPSYIAPQTFANGGLMNANIGGDIAPLNFMDRIKQFGQWGADETNQNLLGLGVGGLQTIGGIIDGFNARKDAKTAMNLQRQQWDKSFARQGSIINEQYYDRQRKRQAANPNAMSPEEYLKKFGV